MYILAENPNDLAFFFGAMIGLYIIMGLILIGIIIGIITIVIFPLLKIFQKANKDGLSAIIPIYNQYILCKIVGVNPHWVLLPFIVFFVNYFFMIFTNILTVIFYVSNFMVILSYLHSVINLLSIVVVVYFIILLNVSLARSFGKKDTYAIGLVLLPIVFYPILAFGKSKYVGANPMKDFIFRNNNENNQLISSNDLMEKNILSNEKQCKIRYCSNCGVKVDDNSQFCSICGNQINRKK